MFPVAEALVQGLQLGVGVHAGSSSLQLLHLPNERQVVIKQPPLALKLLLHSPAHNGYSTQAFDMLEALSKAFYDALWLRFPQSMGDMELGMFSSSYDILAD